MVTPFFILLTCVLGQTNRLIQEGSEIKIGGVKGIFEAEFRSMEDKLDEVRRILAGTNVTQHDLDRLQDSLNNIRYYLVMSHFVTYIEDQPVHSNVTSVKHA